MPCYSPAIVQITSDIISGEVSYKWLGKADNFIEGEIALKNKYNLSGLGGVASSDQRNHFQIIPCGKCIGCRIDYSRSWADRLTYHSIGKEETSFFLCLTYDEDHVCDLPYSANYNLYSLQFDDMTDFIKTIRNRNPGKDIDYYYCGEYGGESFRPHFHMILYGLSLNDLKFFKLNDNGDPIYTSDYLSDIWKKGFVTVSYFDWHAAAYCAGYVIKKLDGRRLDEYTAVGLFPEKCRSSRRPGIAFDFYKKNFEEIWTNNGLSVDRTVNSSGKLGIPRYFQKLARASDDRHERELYYQWQKSSLDSSVDSNFLKIQNSSFDHDRIFNMLKFEEREVLHNLKNDRN